MNATIDNAAAVKQNLVTYQNSQGMEGRGTVLRLSRHAAAFEIYGADTVLRTSELLRDFKIVWHDRTVYSGRAVVRNLVHTGFITVCEVTLDEGWSDVDFSAARDPEALRSQFKEFLQEWQKYYRVLPDFKAVVGDMQTFMTDLRLWLEQVELGIRSSPSADRAQLERQVVADLAGPVVHAIDSFIARFEFMAEGLDEELQPVHRSYLRRQLHPLVMCSPFAYRTFHKPLGYAGDYEVVAMMLRSPHEGSTLFAKMINTWLLGQAPAQAHRNRIDYLRQKLLEEGMRARARGRPARIYNLGCGPANEVELFLGDQPLADHTEFTLLDFNDETLAHTRATLERARQRAGRTTKIECLKRSVHQILKERGRVVRRTAENQYDLVYCAGLFDYLSDNVCRHLMNHFYELVAPGGLLVATNVSDALNRSHPFRYSMEYILDWHLIYRGGDRMGTLKPDAAPAEQCKLIADDTGVNVFLEVRKPDDA